MTAARNDQIRVVLNAIETGDPAAVAVVELPLRQGFATIGIEAGKPFSMSKLTAAQKSDLDRGMKAGLETIKASVATLGKRENGWRIATKGFGDRASFDGDDTLRAAVAMAGIYGNDAVEALYPLLATDSDGNKPDSSVNRYTITFQVGQLPPVHAFRSDGPLYLVMRLYWPKDAALDGALKPPALQRVN